MKKKMLVVAICAAMFASSTPKAHAWPSMRMYALDFEFGASAIAYGLTSIIADHYNGFGGFY